MNEELFTGFLAGLFPAGGPLHTGIGDDCAVLDLCKEGDKLFLYAVDQVIENRHYLPETPPELVAGKLLKRNISDIAAMGGTPLFALVTIAANPLAEAFLLPFYKGLKEEAEKYHIQIAGGDTARLPYPPPLSGSKNSCVATLSIFGEVKRDKLCLRSNGKEGDLLYATGTFGNSFASSHHLSFTPRLEEAAFLAGTYTNSMMDISDGLEKDSQRLAEASHLSLTLFPDKIPLREGATQETALHEGEDYELIFTVSPEKEALLLEKWPFMTRLSRIGKLIGKEHSISSPSSNSKGGFDHFHE